MEEYGKKTILAKIVNRYNDYSMSYQVRRDLGKHDEADAYLMARVAIRELLIDLGFRENEDFIYVFRNVDIGVDSFDCRFIEMVED